MKYKDLRDWLTIVEDLGELKKVNGAHWDLEVGTLTEIAHSRRPGPALLFDEVVGHAPGYRLLVNSLGSANRLALALGLPLGLSDRELKEEWKRKSKELLPVPARKVSDGPVMENVFKPGKIDMTKFPAPRWHELDGGRYIGTGCLVISQDPDEGWVNLGTYRMMLQDKEFISLYISPGKHGRIHRDKHFGAKKPFPVAVSLGQDPLLFLCSSIELPYGMCEYDYAGAIRGEPIPVISGPVTGLPIPADAEIVVEGFCHYDRGRPEGPFGEWTGYYASAQRQEPVLEVKALYHRHQPMLLGSPPGKPPIEQSYYRAIMRSGLIEEELMKAGVPDVKGVWCHEPGASRLLTVVSIHQRYPGHARQAGLISAFCHAGAYLGRFVIVVDEDVDITNLEEVMWVVCTRCDPTQDIEIVRRCWSGPLDPIIPADKKGLSSRAIIDATRPYEWKDQFPPVAQASPELKEKVMKKWAHIFTTD